MNNDTEFSQEVLLLFYLWNNDWGPMLKSVLPKKENFINSKINVSMVEMIKIVQDRYDLKSSLWLLVDLNWIKKESLIMFNTFEDENSIKQEIIVALVAPEIPQNHLPIITKKMNDIITIIKENKSTNDLDFTKKWRAIKSLFLMNNI